MRKRSILSAASVVVCAVLAASDASAAFDPQTKAALDQYCVTCHNARLKTAGLALESGGEPITGNAVVWEKVVRKLRLGVMPPQGSRRPDQATYDRLIASLEGELDASWTAHPSQRDPGRPV